MIKCRKISRGKSTGELIVSNKPLSFLGGVNPDSGVVIDPHHDLSGQCIKDKILFGVSFSLKKANENKVTKIG